MRKRWLTMLCLLPALLLILLGLAGCGKTEEPALLQTPLGVFNTDDRLIAAAETDYYFPGQEVSSYILPNGKTVLQVENHFVLPPEQRFQVEAGQVFEDDFGWRENFYRDFEADLRISGRSFRFYDCYGQLLHSVDIEAAVPNPNCLEFYAPTNGDWQNGLFVVDLLQTEGRYQLLDIAGNLLVDKQRQLRRQGYDDRLSLGVIPAAAFLSIAYNDFNPKTQLDNVAYLDIYDWQGQPLTTEHDYFELFWLGGFRYADLPFYLAHYSNEKGGLRYDILDAQGRVRLANLSLVDYLGSGVLAVTQGWGDMQSGFADLQGRWLDGNLMNLSREMRLFYNGRDIYNTNGLLLAKQQWPAVDGLQRDARIVDNQVWVEEIYFTAWNPEQEDFKPVICRHLIYDAWGRLLSRAEHELTGAAECNWLSSKLFAEPELPPELLQKYMNIGIIYAGAEPSGYFRGRYETAAGQSFWEVLDGQGRVILSGLKYVRYLGENIFWVQQGFSQGLMNDKGEWIVQETIFKDMED